MKTKRAGLVPFKVENGSVFVKLMKPSDPEYGGDRFQIAKGVIENGHTDIDTAYREAEEELGLKLDNISGIRYLDKVGNIVVYYGEILKDEWDEPHYETGETIWFDLDDVEESELIRDFHRGVLIKLKGLLCQK